MLLFGILNDSTWFGFSSSMIERMRASPSSPSCEKRFIFRACEWDGVQAFSRIASRSVSCSRRER